MGINIAEHCLSIRPSSVALCPSARRPFFSGSRPAVSRVSSIRFSSYRPLMFSLLVLSSLRSSVLSSIRPLVPAFPHPPSSGLFILRFSLRRPVLLLSLRPPVPRFFILSFSDSLVPSSPCLFVPSFLRLKV